MADLQTKTSTQIVQDYAAAAMANCKIVLDFTIGSINLAYAEAISDVALWLQGLIAYVLTLRWATTSQKTDLDSWMADWTVIRLPARATTDVAEFSRITPTLAAYVPIGMQIGTQDGSQIFQVYADPSNPAYSADVFGNGTDTPGYPIAAGVPSVIAPVQALVAGTAGNIAAGTLTTLRAGVSGIDAVTNLTTFYNGKDAETDAAFRARFPDFIASLRAGTVGAIRYAVTSLEQGLQVVVDEFHDYDGTYDSDMNTVIIDDGSGNMPQYLLDLCRQRIDLIRAAGIRVQAVAAVRSGVSCSLSLVIDEGYVAQIVRANVEDAVAAYISGVGLGNPVDYGRVYAIAFAIPGVTNVTDVFLNGAKLDIVPTTRQTIKSVGVQSASN